MKVNKTQPENATRKKSPGKKASGKNLSEKNHPEKKKPGEKSLRKVFPKNVFKVYGRPYPITRLLVSSNAICWGYGP